MLTWARRCRLTTTDWQLASSKSSESSQQQQQQQEQAPEGAPPDVWRQLLLHSCEACQGLRTLIRPCPGGPLVASMCLQGHLVACALRHRYS
jgi:hypothetical protein